MCVERIRNLEIIGNKILESGTANVFAICKGAGCCDIGATYEQLAMIIWMRIARHDRQLTPRNSGLCRSES